MIAHALVTALVVLTAATPSGRSRKSGTSSKPAATAPGATAPESTPASPEPAPPAAQPRVSEGRPNPAAKPGGLTLPPISAGVMLGPALPIGNGAARVPGAGTPIWGRLVASGTLPLTRLGTMEIALGLGLGFQRYSVRGTSGTVGFGFDLFPAGRATLPLIEKLSVYAELGLGLVFYNTTYQVPFTGYQSIGASGSGLRLGGGLSYALGDRLSIVFEPIGFMLASVTSSVTVLGQTYTATATGSQWSFLVGATLRL